MIDVSDLLIDPDFTETYIVHRNTGEWVNGRFVTTPTSFSITAPAQPLSVKELEIIPEADRQKGILAFWSVVSLYKTGEGRISDEIEYKGNHYKIMDVLPRNTWYKAIGIQMEAK